MHEIILIVDDNIKLLEGMKMRLEMARYQVLLAYDGQSALDLLKIVTPHLIVADVMMPHMNGWELFQRVRNDPRLNTIPFIFVTARSDDDSIQRGKELGAEDYLVKPFKAEELEASIKGRLLRSAQLARQTYGQTAEVEERKIIAGDLLIDLKAHRIQRGDTDICLSPTEFNILSYLSQKSGQVIKFEELAQATSPANMDGWDNQDSIRVHIKNIRKKIEVDPSNPKYIINVRGVGYRFDD